MISLSNKNKRALIGPFKLHELDLHEVDQCHSQRSHHTQKPDISASLSLIDAPVKTLDTQYHCTEIGEKATQVLNPGQICVDESRQPVHKLSQELHWRFHNRFGSEKCFWLFGFFI